MEREDLKESGDLIDDCFYIWYDIAALNKPVTKLLHDADALGLLCCYDDHDMCNNINGIPLRRAMSGIEY